MKQLKIINPEKASEKEVKSYPVREAARAVVVDENGMIALVHVSSGDYYKIPGGGIKSAEDKIIALKRECQEEIGCNIKVIQEIGSIVEYRKMFNLVQISYCYLAKLKGTKGTPNFTTSEQEEGFKVLWLPYKKALQAMIQSAATIFEASAYMVPRDTIFLKEARKHIIKLGK